jgi:hypothetical protein
MYRAAYHATQPDDLAAILASGLIPQVQRHPGEERCIPSDEPAIFFCPTHDLALAWGSVVLRFPWPDDAVEDSYGDAFLAADGCVMRTNWFTRLQVPPADIEVMTIQGVTRNG